MTTKSKYSVTIYLKSENRMEVGERMMAQVDGYIEFGITAEGRHIKWVSPYPSKTDAFSLARTLSDIAEENNCDYYIVIKPTVDLIHA